jgi:hypothetical protein
VYLEWGEDECIYCFGGKVRKKGASEKIVVKWRIILKCILERHWFYTFDTSGACGGLLRVL